ncbi:MAG: cytochrome b/b6 domain-containing protein [Gammaproteobacteria bacterium]
MNPAGKTKYDPLTRWLHAALAAAVVFQLLTDAVMRVPPGVGQGVRDWHREMFEIHAHAGPAVAVICALHWLWICLPWSRPGLTYLFPWMQRDRRATIYREFKNLLQFETPSPRELSPLTGSVHGLGLLAVTGSVAGGLVSYLGYFAGLPIPAPVLHWAALEQITMVWFVWAFVIGHVSMALWHWSGGHASQLDRT